VNPITSEPHKELLMAMGVATLFALAGLYLPVLGVAVSMFIPLPILFYRSKLGRSKGVMVLVFVTVVVATAMRWRSITSTVFFFELGFIGLILSEMFEMDFSLEKTVAVTTGVAVGTAAAIFALYGLLTPSSLWDQMSGYLLQNLQLFLDVYKEMEVSQERIAFLADSMEGILYVLLRITPAIVVSSTLLVVWSNLLVARPLLRSKHLYCPDFGTLNEWKAPEPLVWAAILSAILLLVPHKGLRLLGANGLIIMMMIYFFQGIAIVSYYFEKKRAPRLLRGLIYGLIALQQFVLLVVIAAGFFDLWVNFRRLGKGVDKKDESNTERTR
jgi:uncharacterized protein YybS (DUF2232 family)